MEKVPSPPPCISVVYFCLSPVLKDPSEFLRSSVFVSLQPLINCKCHFELKRNVFFDVRKSSHLFKRPCRSSLPPSTSVFVSRPAGLHTGWVWSKLQYSSLYSDKGSFGELINILDIKQTNEFKVQWLHTTRVCMFPLNWNEFTLACRSFVPRTGFA